MVVKLLDRIKNDKIKVGVKCGDCGNILDYERFVYELNFRSNKKQIVLCVTCASILQNEI